MKEVQRPKPGPFYSLQDNELLMTNHCFHNNRKHLYEAIAELYCILDVMYMYERQ